jgi:PKHD-type hydroxylase
VTYRFDLGPIANPHFQQAVSRPLFDRDQCESIIALGSEERWEAAGITQPGSSQAAYDGKIRSAGLQTLSDDGSWPLGQLVTAIGEVNDEVFRFNLSGMYDSDAPSLARYRAEETDHFRPHKDAGEHNSRRKLTYVVQLSAGDHYQGGDLLINDGGKLGPRAQGTLVVFPSTLTHVVSPVTAGVRYVIVGWILGPTLS